MVHVRMVLLNRRFKPFVLIVSLLFLSLLYALNSFFTNYENEAIINFFYPELIEREEPRVDFNQHLLLLRVDYEKILAQYETSRRNFGKKFEDAVKDAYSFNNLQMAGKISMQNIVCNYELFLLIQVHSDPKNFMSRQAIRLSWGSMENVIGNSQEMNATLR